MKTKNICRYCWVRRAGRGRLGAGPAGRGLLGVVLRGRGLGDGPPGAGPPGDGARGAGPEAGVEGQEPLRPFPLPRDPRAAPAAPTCSSRRGDPRLAGCTVATACCPTAERGCPSVTTEAGGPLTACKACARAPSRAWPQRAQRGGAARSQGHQGASALLLPRARLEAGPAPSLGPRRSEGVRVGRRPGTAPAGPWPQPSGPPARP